MPNDVVATNTAAIVAQVRTLADRIPDPCGLAQAVSIGMVEMGLVRDVIAMRERNSWTVMVLARVTSPECLHFVYFERELRAALERIPDIGQVHVEWEPGFDRTPADISGSARERLRARRDKMDVQVESKPDTGRRSLAR